MILLAAAGACLSGVALLRLLRMGTGSWVVDVPLGWMVGSAWFALGAFALRAVAGVAPGGLVAVALLGLPVAGWAAVRPWKKVPGGQVAPAPDPGVRRLPRPAWIFAPMVTWTLVVAVGVVIHGASTPTHTDDAYRVRGLAPVLVASGDWSGQARQIVAMAGPIPSFVPALPWMFGAPIEPLQVQWASILSFLALVGVVAGAGASRRTPEAGWGGAFALASIPLLAYHATSAYSDAWLASYMGCALAFLVAYGRTGDPADAGRTLLLLLGAAMVKREGEILAAPAIGILLAQVAWRSRQEGWRTTARLLGICSAGLVVVASRVVAVGVDSAFPFLRAAAARAGAASAAVATSPATAQAQARPGVIFVQSLLVDGNVGILYWVLLLSVVALFPRIRSAGLAWSGAALAVAFAQTAASALWLYPQFTIDHSTVHRSLLPVSAMAAVWVAALLAPAPGVAATPAAAEPRSVRRARRRAGARA